MTNKEKQQRKKIRDEQRRQGILPPRKPRLDRKAYARDVLTRYQQQAVLDADLREALREAIICMIPDIGVITAVDAEQTGVLKLLDMAMRITEYKSMAAVAGRKVTHLELWEHVIKPIYNL